MPCSHVGVFEYGHGMMPQEREMRIRCVVDPLDMIPLNGFVCRFLRQDTNLTVSVNNSVVSAVAGRSTDSARAV